MFYRLKALSEAGWAITLHCFYKGELIHHKELESLCKAVHYYPRHTDWRQLFHVRPYAVVSRTDNRLLANLLTDDAPILFEGLVSCALIGHPALAKRDKYLRECNIEHRYYAALGKAAAGMKERLYYYSDALKLQLFERKAKAAKAVFAIAHQDEAHYRKHYPNTPVIYLPASHPNSSVRIAEGRGSYILYHGNLDVAENYNAVRIIAEKIAPQLADIPIVIAGRYNSHVLDSLPQAHPNIQLIANPDEHKLAELIRDAQIHLLITEQATGLKLKLLNVLYNGRHVIVNDKMVAGTELASLCHIGTTADEIIELCRRYFPQAVSTEEREARANLLSRYYDNRELATIITNHLIPS